MKVKITYQTPEVSVNETFSGGGSEAVVAAMKSRMAAESGFVARIMINSMSPLSFAQEVVRRYNKHFEKRLPEPQSCDEFLALAESEGIAQTVER